MRLFAWIIGILLVIGLTAFIVSRLRMGPNVAASDALIEREFIEYLRTEFPFLVIERPSSRELKLRGPGEESVLLALDNAISDARGLDGGGRKAAYERFTSSVRMWLGGKDASLTDKKESVLPRLVHREFIESMGNADVIARSVGDTPLRMCFVVSENGQAQFLMRSDLAVLGVTENQLDMLALRNARPMVSSEELADIFANPRRLIVIDGGDAFNATRILVLKEMLRPGQVLGVAVPDRDTLVVAADPDESTWNRLAAAARKPASARTIFERPLKVTAEQIEAH